MLAAELLRIVTMFAPPALGLTFANLALVTYNIDHAFVRQLGY